MKISELKDIATRIVKEMSGTSGGTAQGSTVTGGPEGEQTFTPVTVKKPKKVKKVKQEVKDVEPKLAAGKVKDNYYVSHFGYTPAPSVPNRKSKAMDYKQLFEQEVTLIDDLAATLSSDASKNIKIPKGSKVKVLVKRMPNEPKVTQLDYNGEVVNVNAQPFIQQYLTLKEENVGGEDLEVDDRVKVVYGNQFYGETGTITDIKRGFVTVEMDGDGNEYSMHSSDVEKIEDEDDDDDNMLGEAKQEWAIKNIEALINDYATKHNLAFTPVDKKQQTNQYGSKKTVYIYKLGDKDLVMIDDKAAGAPRLNDFKVVVGTLEPGTTVLKNTLSVSKFGSYGIEDVVKMLDRAFENKGLTENYSQFRNKTSKRDAPEQLHKAVKEIKKKLQEVDRLVEYTNRLRTEVNEGGKVVEYNTHTARALEQIQEMIKHTYIKAKKLK